ncbi:MAG: hypothetical protein PWQ87_823 [Candidatus Woesearchaeota archaeon]|nr:hypothetical protein [Candidatus Woesearchaeota archaeon]
MAVPLISVFLIIVATFLGAFGGLLLKKSSTSFSFNPFKLIKNKMFISGVLLYLLSTALFIPALKGNELSIIYPLTALSYVWVVFLSALFLKERINYKKIFGIGMIITGVVILTLA